MSGRAVLGRPGAVLETALAHRVAEARAADPYGPLTVLVGSNLLGAHLKRALAGRHGGLFNVRFETFADLARILSARAAPPAFPPLADLVIVEEIVSSTDVRERFGEAAATRGFGEALLATFNDLAEGGCTAEIARAACARGAAAGPGGMTRDVCALYAAFRERVEALGGDAQTSFFSALAGPVPPEFGRTVLAYGFYDFNEMQRRLLARLARDLDVTAFVPWRAGEAYRFARSASKLLEGIGFEIGAPLADAGAPPPVAPALMNAPDGGEEIREIARRILGLAPRMPFGEIALLVPSPDAYVPLVREVFAEAGIPCSLRPDAAAEKGPVARGVLALARMLGGAMERRDLVEFLVSAPLGPPPAACGGEADRSALWVRKSAEAGIAGERSWAAESAALVERLRAVPAPSPEDREALAAAIEVDGILGKILAAREEARRRSGWKDRASLLSGLARELFPPSEERDAARAEIDALAALDAVAPAGSFEIFSRLVESALAGTGRARGALGGGGVEVLTLAQARGLAFRAVFVPGLAERIFPTVTRQDPFLPDAERRALASRARGAVRLSEKSGRIAEEALLFALAREAAREELVVSWPRFEEGTGKERIPSSFLRFIDGYAIDGRHAGGLRVERVPRGGARARGAALLSADELDFEEAAGFLRGSGSLPDNGHFARGARLVRGRWGTRRFTPYDGVFSSREAAGELRRMLEDDGMRFAPTSLESYASCPFDYFISRVLRITVLEEPERLISITPLQRGDIVHTILARVYGELETRGLLPLRTAPAAEATALAGRIVERFLEDYPKEEPVGLPVFWEMEKRLVRESVRLLLEEERIEEDDFVPARFEGRFGGARDGIEVPFETAGRVVRFRGRIDRLDLAPGGRFRVVDYKTGKLLGKDEDLARGDALQLPVYLLAAARILGLDIHAGEARYRRVGTAEGKKVVVFSGSSWDEASPRLAAIVDVVTGGIERGIFFAPADETRCRFCDVKLSCPAGMSRLFQMKAAGDERARPYLAMRAGEEEA